MRENPRVVHVRHVREGWWEVTTGEGASLAQHTSEFTAREAGRIHAVQLEADLVIEQGTAPAIYEVFDEGTGTLVPLPNPRRAAVPLEKPASDRKWLVLVVEDLLDARELYADYLTYAGFSVATAINGHDAVRLARLLGPDLVLMDIRMPGMDGLEATADLKRDPRLAHIPVVAITADPSEDVAEKCREVGCDAFILKPVLPDVVAAKIRRLLTGGGDLETRGASPRS